MNNNFHVVRSFRQDLSFQVDSIISRVWRLEGDGVGGGPAPPVWRSRGRAVLAAGLGCADPFGRRPHLSLSVYSRFLFGVSFEGFESVHCFLVVNRTHTLETIYIIVNHHSQSVQVVELYKVYTTKHHTAGGEGSEASSTLLRNLYSLDCIKETSNMYIPIYVFMYVYMILMHTLSLSLSLFLSLSLSHCLSVLARLCMPRIESVG